VLASAELYDPTTGTWSFTGSMTTPRYGSTTTLLLNHRVLVAGEFGFSASAEIYDPTTGIWTPTASMNVGRYTNTATFLNHGRVLVAGGRATASSYSASAEIFSTSADTTPPTITAAASPLTLWPPNGKMVSVTVGGMMTDNEPGGTGVNANTATYAVTDEYGLIQPKGRITLSATGTYSFAIQLQAARNGNDGNGRQYIITVIAQDNAGNEGSAVTFVTVPHDRGN